MDEDLYRLVEIGNRVLRDRSVDRTYFTDADLRALIEALRDA